MTVARKIAPYQQPTNQARHEPYDDPSLLSARVMRRDGNALVVAIDDGPGPCRELNARRAASCLLSPEVGDRVLIVLSCPQGRHSDPEPFVLAVLERDGGAPAELSFDGDARIRARGRLDLNGEGALHLGSRGPIRLLSRILSVRSGRTELYSEQLDAVAKKARASFDELAVVSRIVDRVAERISERAERVYRFVGELDQLRARHFDYRAEESAQIKGDNTMVTARQVVKVDGEQVHIG